MEHEKNKKRRGLKIFLIIIACLVGLVLVAGAGVYLYVRNIYSGFTDPDAPDIVEPSETYKPDLEVPEEDFSSDKPTAEEGEDEPLFITDETPLLEGHDELTPIYKVKPIDKNIVNILFLGIDVEDFEKYGGGRSDSMIMLSFNKTTGEVQMFSFMRDSLVPIEGVGWTKLNHTYAYGKAGLTINTLNNLFGLDIQKYAVIDWSGLRDIVNHIGGIDVNLTAEEAEYYNRRSYIDGLVPGKNHINGTVALVHSRNRTLGADYERTRRQRDVLMAIYNEVMGRYDVSEMIDFVEFASTAVKTNISFGMMTSYATSLYRLKDGVNISPYQVPLPDTYEGGWYNCTEGWLSVVKIDITENKNQILDMIYGKH